MEGATWEEIAEVLGPITPGRGVMKGIEAGARAQDRLEQGALGAARELVVQGLVELADDVTYWQATRIVVVSWTSAETQAAELAWADRAEELAAAERELLVVAELSEQARRRIAAVLETARPVAPPPDVADREQVEEEASSGLVGPPGRGWVRRHARRLIGAGVIAADIGLSLAVPVDALREVSVGIGSNLISQASS